MSEQMKGAAVEGLPPCKRYIATHDSNGISVYADSPEQVFNGIPGGGGVARSVSDNRVLQSRADFNLDRTRSALSLRI